MRYFILCSFLIFGVGCVSNSKYEALQSESKEQAKKNQATIEEQRILIAQLEEKLGAASSDKESLRASIDQMKQALAEMTKRQKEADNRIAEYRDLLRRFRSLTETGQLSVRIEDGRMIVGLPSDVLFASGSARLSAEGANTIRKVTQVLREIPKNRYQVEGHTDNVPIRSSQFPSNWELASARGLNVAKMMVEAGLSADRVSAASFGEFHPIASNDTPEGRNGNRRIEIVVVPDLSSLPGHEELQRIGSEKKN